MGLGGGGGGVVTTRFNELNDQIVITAEECLLG